MEPIPVKLKELLQLEALYQSRVILYITDDRTFPPRTMMDEDLPILYDCLQTLPTAERLDLILYTGGGPVNVGRKIILLLRDFAPQVRVLVPYKAHSAGTLLCLGANEIVMGRMAELSPIDPHLSATGEVSSEGPRFISSEDIRTFREIAQNWFGLKQEEHWMHIFNLLSQRIFPTTLSTFYRADRQTQQIATELLRYQLSDEGIDRHQQIVEQLLHGYDAHDYAIFRTEAKQLGLRVSWPSREEEMLLWCIWKTCRSYLNTHIPIAGTTGANQPTRTQTADSLIISATFTAVHTNETIEYISMNNSGLPSGGKTIRATTNSQWQILNHKDV